jgi:hypothetical protein
VRIAHHILWPFAKRRITITSDVAFQFPQHDRVIVLFRITTIFSSTFY